MRYDPENANKRPVIKEGYYDGELLHGEEATSKKSGNPMLVVDVKVYDGETGNNVTIREYFTESTLFRLKRMCAATGIDFDAGEVTSDMIHGQAVRVYVVIQEDKTGKYSPSNKIGKWESPNPPPAVAVTAPASTDPPTIPDDDIPF